jgi:hypothetical protein
MGSSGMKRKGRRHLPKVGTRPANEQALDDRRAEALHPFSDEPWRRRGTAYGVAAVVMVLVVATGIIALIAAT